MVNESSIDSSQVDGRIAFRGASSAAVVSFRCRTPATSVRSIDGACEKCGIAGVSVFYLRLRLLNSVRHSGMRSSSAAAKKVKIPVTTNAESQVS